MNEFKTTISEDYRDIKSDAWNSLSKSLYTSFEWLECVVKSGVLPGRYFFIQIYNQNKLVAFAITYIQKNELYSTINEAVLGPLKKIWPAKLSPCLLCYSPLSVVGQGFEIENEYLKDSDSILSLIVKQMKNICQREKIRNFGFSNVKEIEYLTNFFKRKNNFIKIFTSFDTYIDLAWRDFDGYMEVLGQRRRNMIKKEIKKHSQAVFKKVKNNEIDLEKAVEIINTTERETEKKYLLPVQFYQSLKENFGSRFSLTGEEKDGELIAVFLSIEYKNVIYAFKVGQKKEITKGYFNIFILCFYDLIKYAIEKKFTRINYSTGTYGYKVNRGAKISPQYLYLKSFGWFNNLLNNIFLPLASKIKFRKHIKKVKSYL